MQQLAEAALAQVPGFKTCPACSSGAIHADANADHPRIICQSCGVAACFVCGARYDLKHLERALEQELKKVVNS